MPTYRSGKRPFFVVTLGHPTGIGPEVTLKALSDKRIASLGSFLLIGDGTIVKKESERLGIRFSITTVQETDLRKRRFTFGKITLLQTHDRLQRPFSYGSAAPRFGAAAIGYIRRAVTLLNDGIGDALVTAPIHKASAQRSGFRFPGHTEYLAHLTKTKKYAMMLIGGNLKVTLVSRHIPLKKVAASLTLRNIRDAITLTDRILQKGFGIKKPRIGIAGLNPHAGEGGLLGKEEQIIRRAMKKIRGARSVLIGPRPPDAIFYEALHNSYDAVVAMFHDQGLIPLKMLYFDSGVNLTLGLPFVRTSPDHGTALTIAGKGSANPESMKAAIRVACRLTGA